MLGEFISKITLTVILCSFSFLSIAQTQRTGNTSNLNQPSTNQRNQAEVPKEKAYVNYYKLSDKDHIVSMQDTGLNGFEIFPVHKEFEKAALTLGNPGSSAYPIQYRNRTNIFTDLGFKQYSIYRLELEDFKFFKLNRPYNDLFFSPQSGQQNFIAKAKFSQNIGGNMNLSIDFERIKQEGLYDSQDSKMTRFGIGLSKLSKNHDLFLVFIANNFNELHNGGISVDINSDEFSDPIYRSQRSSIDTYLNDGNGRHQYFSYSIENIWKPEKTAFQLSNQTRLEHGYYRYSDEDVDSSQDSTVYLSYLKDSRGIRMINKFIRLGNHFQSSFKYKNLDLSAGLDYRILSYNNENSTRGIHDLALTGDINFNVPKLGDISGHVEIALGDNAGNFLLDAELNLKLAKGIELLTGIESSRYDPFLFQEELFVTEQLVYSNSFSKINEIKLTADLNIDPLNLELRFNSGLIDKAIAYDSLALPYQLDGSTEYIQAMIKHTFFWKFIGMDNEFIYQDFSENIYRLPEIYSRHNLYLQGRLFRKRLMSRIGMQLYNIIYDGAVSFMPVSGVFYPDNSMREYFPISDVYMNFKVDKFMVFFKYDNFVDLFQKKVHFQISNYPQMDANFRMGIRWIFSD